MAKKKIIFFEHAVETLGFFSKKLIEALQPMEYETLLLDFNHLDSATRQIKQFYTPHVTFVVTFNFIAFSGEPDFTLPDGQTIWQRLSIPCFNILVDHPLYYYKTMITMPDTMTILCIDRLHLDYMRRYYPFHKNIGFLPLGGTAQTGSIPQLKDRTHPVIFTANYVPPTVLEQSISHVSQDYRDFYEQIIQTFLSEPDHCLDTLFEEFLLKEFPQITVGETLACMHGMLFIDLYIRTWFRKKIVHTIADAGIPVLLVGKDWEQSGCRHPKNLICTGMVDSASCLSYMYDSKIALNVMPWFKDGAHDRIFNAMLQGCVSLTDTTPYLTEQFVSDQDYLTYHLSQLDRLPALITSALEHPGQLQDMADCGYEKSLRAHTWNCRAKQLAQLISNYKPIENLLEAAHESESTL